MELKIVQQKKDLYEAQFVIMEGQNVAGNINLLGALGSMEANININYKNNEILLKRTKRREVVEKTKGLIKSSFFNNSHNRPYNIISNNQKGFVFLQCASKALEYFHFQKYNEDNYYMYVIGFGEKGICAPIYKDNICIGELHKDCVVKDDLHIFDLIIQNESDIIPFIIFAIYFYLTSYYKAGVKLVSGINKDVYITTEKERIQLCKNPYYLQ